MRSILVLVMWLATSANPDKATPSDPKQPAEQKPPVVSCRVDPNTGDVSDCELKPGHTLADVINSYQKS